MDKQNITALFPGSFKPPHKGHFKIVEKVAKICDEVQVIISSQSREGYGPYISEKIWKQYKTLLPENVKILISASPSPITEIYQIVKDKSKDYLVIYGKGEQKRYRHINENKQKYKNVDIFDVGNIEEISATKLRKAINERNLNEIKKLIPEGININKFLLNFQIHEDKIPGGLAKGKSLIDIARYHRISQAELYKQLEKGIKVEMEHTTSKSIAKEIAMDHLWEDPKYYDKLSSIEEGKDYHARLVAMAKRKDPDRLTSLGKEYLPENDLEEIKIQPVRRPDVSGITVDGKEIEFKLDDSLELDCNNKNLKSLEIFNKNIKFLYCGENQLTSLNLQGLTNLLYIHCSNNQLSTLNIQGLTNLLTLSCSNNQLPTLNLQGLTNLRTLYCYNNQLSSLDVQGLTNLKFLSYDEETKLIGKETTQLNEINESKNLGNLYHFTDLESLDKILESNMFLPSTTPTHDHQRDFQSISREKRQRLKDKGETSLYYISFSRDKLFYKKPTKIGRIPISRIQVNGNKLSTKYKFIPFNYYSDEIDSEQERYNSNEGEERIILPNNKGILNINNYIIKIDILLDKIEDVETYLKQAEELIKKYPNINLLYKEKPITMEEYRKNILPDIEPYRDEEFLEIIDKTLNEVFQSLNENIEVNSGLYMELLNKCLEECCQELNIPKPELEIINDDLYTKEYNSYGGYSPTENKIYLVIYGRDCMSSVRSLSHEIKHHHQNIEGRLTNNAGEDGDIFENECNSYSGSTCRWFGRKYPEAFFLRYD